MFNIMAFKNNFSLIVIFILYFCFINSSFSAVKIKGGVITSAEVLKTEKPKPRDDLIFNLNNFDKTHLNQKLTIEEAQLVEHRSPKPGVVGSSPIAPAIY